MFDILLCIRDDHEIRLVTLAAIVCFLTSGTAVLMLRQSVQVNKAHAQAWRLAGGFASGFGIWATHFIAMLGYQPGFIAGYHLGLTLCSLALVLSTTILGFYLATRQKSVAAIASGALVTGGGFAAMHYLGMEALQIPAMIRWNAGYVGISIAIAILPLYPAMTIAVARRSSTSGCVATLFIALAIIGLHFSGMTAIHLIPSRMAESGMLLSPGRMSLLIATVTLLLLGACLAGWIIARRTSAAIAASQRQFSILVKGISDCAIYLLDKNAHVANWNPGAQRLKGYSEDEVLGAPLAQFYTPSDRLAGLPEEAVAMARTEGKFVGEGWRVRKDGSSYWAHDSIERIHDDDGKLIGFANIIRDMTRYKQDQDRIEEARLQLDAALEHMHQGLCLFDAHGRLVLRNRQFVRLWKLPDEACPPGTGMMEVARAALEARTGATVPRERLENMRALLAQSLGDPDLPPLVSEFGEHFSVSISSRAMPGGGWVSTFEDITERRRSEARITHLAHHDGLTGLPNRSSFNRWLDREIDGALRMQKQLGLVAIDLDRFKDINDSHGHAVGDAVLQQLAEALRDVIGEGEIAARLGGDEFAAAKLFSHPQELADFAARLESCLSARKGDPLIPVVGASMGIAVFPNDAEDREALLNNADLAMYRAKTNPSETTCYYEHGMDEKARRRRQLANDLRLAIDRGELALVYQEQRSLKTKMLSGYEALLRWHHPGFGPVAPAEFIPIAEETGDIIRIGEWALRTACAEAARWPSQIKIAVNLSPVQLLKPDLPDTIAQVLLETRLPARRLELEITESAIISEKIKALHSLRRIKALGISVAMDDFGTGYSSLDTLHSFPFDRIKIDKSFLLRAEGNHQARTIIRAVLALGRSLGMPVLAEGVETQRQLELLIDEGCDEAQGYYFGRPVPIQGDAPGFVLAG
ncbi:bifunctional diguanylate cyclase/phosphodiesterase [Novosphingobium pentaromativorans]|uniref:Diguanylate cyclase/phosphodiesterase with PAS/PAC and MHYT sensor n=1 Tax=Novosphingobium pentaromativorans US6-1 TaxID=1088721 RepID=G6EGZ6_9SPHN|nr:EAL domain-containing protein [Novosphingobium pentaromativorans]AIT82016.1 diguanylate cyclase [Novosphingobium pentaromativorans US6-1]EHJ59285.1 diguanylate cyclase/phosphodiesterase with PAS/PAC and MHYT sensor [Novosphingobium pentaromativorans US6-1]